MLLNPFSYHDPKTLKEAASLYARLDDVRLLAGGTLVLNNLKSLKRKGLKTPKNIISLRKIDELKGVFEEQGDLIIGSMVTMNDLLNNPLMNNEIEGLKMACRTLGTNPIRNMGTVGGNLMSRYTWTELATIFMALDARMNFINPKNLQTIVSVEDFLKNHAKADGILKSVLIKRNKKLRLIYKRVERLAQANMPLLGVCLSAIIEKNRFVNTRAVVNTGISFARRDPLLEKFLNNTPISASVPSEALHHLDQRISDPKSDDYKAIMFRVSLKNAISDLTTER